jgi:hypothetical protein
MTANQEGVRRIAQDRYGLDLQGALKRASFLNANGVEHLDLEGMCRALYGASADTFPGVNGMTFTLIVSPAP